MALFSPYLGSSPLILLAIEFYILVVKVFATIILFRVHMNIILIFKPIKSIMILINIFLLNLFTLKGFWGFGVLGFWGDVFDVEMKRL